MNILFLSDNFPPEVNAPATRTHKHCKYWADEGHNVTVITCVPNFPQGEVYEGYENKLYQKEVIDGIKVIRVWSYITSNKGVVKRTLDYLSFAATSFWIGLFQKADIIVATSPQFFTTWSGWALSKIKQKPWIFELRDLWPDTIEAVGAIQNKSLLNILEKIELFLYRSASMVIAVTQNFKDNLVSRGINSSKIKVVTNGTDLDMFQPQEKNKELLKKFDLGKSFVVGYVGTHGMTHGLDFILESIRVLEDDDFKFLFLGDGAEKAQLKKMASDLNLGNVFFLDPVPKEEVSDYISLFDVSLVPLKKRDVFKTVIPSKIFEQASMKKPILLGVDGQAREIIENYNAGLFYEPENKTDFIDKLTKLKNDSELYRELQKGCLELAEDYDRKKKAERMLKYQKELVN
jgi:glycosyltransferase involved in cell wall biosynthesis